MTDKLLDELEEEEVEIEPADNATYWSSRVAKFLVQLAEQNEERTINFPAESGFVEYAAALSHWHQKDEPDGCWFCFDEGQEECQWLMEFRKEITNEFGLPIYSQDEVKVRNDLARRAPMPNNWHIN